MKTSKVVIGGQGAVVALEQYKHDGSIRLAVRHEIEGRELGMGLSLYEATIVAEALNLFLDQADEIKLQNELDQALSCGFEPGCCDGEDFPL